MSFEGRVLFVEGLVTLGQVKLVYIGLGSCSAAEVGKGDADGIPADGALVKDMVASGSSELVLAMVELLCETYSICSNAISPGDSVSLVVMPTAATHVPSSWRVAPLHRGALAQNRRHWIGVI